MRGGLNGSASFRWWHQPGRGGSGVPWDSRSYRHRGAYTVLGKLHAASALFLPTVTVAASNHALCDIDGYLYDRHSNSPRLHTATSEFVLLRSASEGFYGSRVANSTSQSACCFANTVASGGKAVMLCEVCQGRCMLQDATSANPRLVGAIATAFRSMRQSVVNSTTFFIAP